MKSSYYVSMSMFVVFGLFGGALFAYVTAKSSDYTIVLTEAGFFPEEITVPLGATVTFVNETNDYFWPASDLHPYHGIYPAFDPKMELEPQSSWSFTFDTVGSWPFHDHLAAYLGGKVNVTPDATISYNEVECGGDDSGCWANYLFKTLKIDGLDVSFDALKYLHAVHPKFASVCHNFAHDIGLKTFILYGDDFELTYKTSYCNGGFYHGFMEGFVHVNNETETVDAFCIRVGNELKDTFPLAEGQCRHGIGHGIMEHLIQTNPHLWSHPEELIDKASVFCVATNHTYDHLMRCVSGIYDVFRTWARAQTDYNIFLEPAVLMDWCGRESENYAKEACYHELGKVLKDTFSGKNGADNFDFKAEIKPDDYEIYAPRAARAAAINIGKQGVREKSGQEIIKLCRALPTELQHECVLGLADGIIFASYPEEEIGFGKAFCESVELREKERRDCFTLLQTEIGFTYGDKRLVAACNMIPEEYRVEACFDSD